MAKNWQSIMFDFAGGSISIDVVIDTWIKSYNPITHINLIRLKDFLIENDIKIPPKMNEYFDNIEPPKFSSKKKKISLELNLRNLNEYLYLWKNHLSIDTYSERIHCESGTGRLRERISKQRKRLSEDRLSDFTLFQQFKSEYCDAISLINNFDQSSMNDEELEQAINNASYKRDAERRAYRKVANSNHLKQSDIKKIIKKLS